MDSNNHPLFQKCLESILAGKLVQRGQQARWSAREIIRVTLSEMENLLDWAINSYDVKLHHDKGWVFSDPKDSKIVSFMEVIEAFYNRKQDTDEFESLR